MHSTHFLSEHIDVMISGFAVQFEADFNYYKVSVEDFCVISFT